MILAKNVYHNKTSTHSVMAIRSKRRLVLYFLCGVMLTTTCVLNLEKIMETNRILWTLEHWEELEDQQKSEIERLHFIYEVANHNHDHDDTDANHNHDDILDDINNSNAQMIQNDVDDSNSENQVKEEKQGGYEQEDIMKLDESENIQKNNDIQLGFNKQNPAGDGGLRAELQRLFGYLSNQDVNSRCKKFNYVGTDKKYFVDFSYPVCFDDEVWGNNTDCIVYSYGNDNNWHFEESMIKDHSCTVYTFDPNLYEQQAGEKQEKLIFKHIGLGDVNQEDVMQRGKRDYLYKDKFGDEALEQARKKPMRTLWGTMREMEHTGKIIDVVKIDREGPRIAYETSALKNLLEDGTYACVRQLVFELHLFGPVKYPDHIRTSYSVLKGLENVGFKIWRSQASKSKTKLETIDDFLALDKDKVTFMYTLSFINTNPRQCH